MDINSAFPSDYLKASDLQGRSVPVTMERVEMQTLGSDEKPILYFQGKDKGLVLNKTNSNTIADMFGGETDTWIGQRIILFSCMVDFQGRQVAAIRVKIMTPADSPAVAPAAPAPAAEPQPTQEMPVDEIPF